MVDKGTMTDNITLKPPDKGTMTHVSYDNPFSRLPHTKKELPEFLNINALKREVAKILDLPPLEYAFKVIKEENPDLNPTVNINDVKLTVEYEEPMQRQVNDNSKDNSYRPVHPSGAKQSQRFTPYPHMTLSGVHQMYTPIMMPDLSVPPPPLPPRLGNFMYAHPPPPPQSYKRVFVFSKNESQAMKQAGNRMDLSFQSPNNQNNQ